MTANRMKVALPVAVVVVALCMLLTVGPVAAFTGYGVGAVFGAFGSGDGQFAGPVGVAVDDSTGDVYVVDQGNGRVERFSSAGGYEAQFDGAETPANSFAFPEAIAVDNSGKSVGEDPSVGDVYVADTGHDVVDKFSATGKYEGQLTGVDGVPFAGVAGIAVDQVGDVWVLEHEARPEHTENGHVDEFNDEGVYVGGFDDTYEHAHAIAVGSLGNIYVARGPSGEGSVHLWTETGGVWSETERAEGSTAIAADPATDDLFVDGGGSVVQYGPAGELLGGFGSGSLSSSEGIAVSGTSSVYVSQYDANTLTLFTYGVFPDVSIDSANTVQRASAKLEGVVNPDGQQVSSCEFEYGTSTAYGQTATCAPAAGAGSSPVAVTAQLGALVAGTTYHYRLVAANANGFDSTADSTFTTNAAVEGVATAGASAVQSASATLQGSLEPNGFDTQYVFEYGPCITAGSCGEAPYTHLTTSENAGSTTEDKLAGAGVSNLEGNQAYHFRIVAENSFGMTRGDESIFTTAIALPQIPGEPSVSLIGAQSAVLNASLNPEHLATRYHFEYGACPSLTGCAAIQSTTDEESSQPGAIGATREIRGLEPLTTYSYRLAASNEFQESGTTLGGEAAGTEGTFTTGRVPSVQAATDSASAVTSSSALVSGTVNPDGQSATYAFELGVYADGATSYGVVFSGPGGTGTVPVEETLGLSGLQPGTTYAYRIAIKSGYGTQTGAPVLFTTAGLPEVLLSPTSLPMLAVPSIALPAEAKTITTSDKTTRKCDRGKKLIRGKCMPLKAKKRAKKTRAA